MSTWNTPPVVLEKNIAEWILDDLQEFRNDHFWWAIESRPGYRERYMALEKKITTLTAAIAAAEPEQHKDLRRSILDAASEVVQGRLLDTTPGCYADEWKDLATGRMWRGPHVVRMCQDLADQIRDKIKELMP